MMGWTRVICSTHTIERLLSSYYSKFLLFPLVRNGGILFSVSPLFLLGFLNQIGAVVLPLTAGFFCLRNRAVHYFSRLKVMIL